MLDGVHRLTVLKKESVKLGEESRDIEKELERKKCVRDWNKTHIVMTEIPKE